MRILFAVTLAAAFFVAACTTPAPQPADSLPPPTTAVPPPTEPPPPSWEQVGVIGGGGGVTLIGPNRVVVHDGLLYITEFGGGRILVLDEAGELVAEHAGGGTEIGQLAGPTGLDLDEAGFMYVGESGTSRVQVFSPDGEPVAVWGQFGVDPGEFGSAMGVAINERLGRVYVADHVNSRIHVYDMLGGLLFMFPRDGDFTHIGDEPDQMWLPIGVGIAGDDTVLVVDSGNQRVQRFTSDGGIVALYPTAPISDPQTIHVEDDGSFWVSGVADGEVGFFDPDGTFRFTLPQPAEGFRAPHGVFTAGTTLWVADTGNNVVRVYEFGVSSSDIPPVAGGLPTPPSNLPPDVRVEMFSFGYTPPTVTIPVGQTVEWANASATPHTATLAGTFDSGPIDPDDAFAYTFNTPGTFSYFCTIHGAALQSGVVVVEPAG